MFRNAMTWVGTVVLAAVSGSLGTAAVNAFQKGRELDIRMVEIGLEILKAPVEGENSKLARDWAVKLVEKNSGVSFEPEDRKALLSNSIAVKTDIIWPTIPPSAKVACEAPADAPDRDLSQSEVLRLWNRDRVNLQICEVRRAAAIAATSPPAQGAPDSRGIAKP